MYDYQTHTHTHARKHTHPNWSASVCTAANYHAKAQRHVRKKVTIVVAIE